MLNKVQLIGRLGKDPEIRNTNAGSVANFSMATSEKYEKNGEKKETTYWHNIVAWNKTAEIIGKYVHKGDMLYVEGKITNRSYEKDGVTRYITEIVVFNIVLLGGGKKEEKQPLKQGDYAPGGKMNPPGYGEDPFDVSTPKTGGTANDSLDDLPF